MKLFHWLLILIAAVCLVAAPGQKKESKGQPASVAAELLDINSATLEQLKALPGIGDVYAQNILKNRPYRRKDELVDRKVIPQATYDKIKDKIIARQKK